MCQYIIWYNILQWVTVLCARPAHKTDTLEHITPDDVLTQFDPPDDEHLLLETCRDMKYNTLRKVRQVDH